MVSEYQDPREYWRRMAKQIGLEEFGTEQDSNMFTGQMSWESGNFNPDVVYGRPGGRGGHGEIGVAQYMDFNVDARGINPLNPKEMLRDAAKWMKEKLVAYGTWEKALASYNHPVGMSNAWTKYGPEGGPTGVEWKQELAASTRDVYLPQVLKRSQSLGPIPGQVVPDQPPEGDPLGGAFTFQPTAPTYFPEYRRIRAQVITDYERAKLTYMQAPKAVGEIEKIVNRSWFENMAERFPYPSPIGGAMRAVVQNQQARSAAMRGNIRAVATTEDVAFTDMVRHQYRAELIDALPALVMTGHVTSDEDVNNLLQPKVAGGFLSEDDVQWARDIFHQLQYMKRPGTVPGQLKPTLQDLHASLEQPARPTPVGVHQLTNQALLQALYQQYVPGRPFGLTEEQVYELYGEAGMDDPKIKQLVSELEPKVVDWEEQWKTSDETIKAYKSGVREFQVPKLDFWQWLKLIISQPMLAAMVALEPVNKYLWKPWTGFVHIEALSGIPGWQPIVPAYGGGLVGGLVGLLAGGPPGAAVGAVVGMAIGGTTGIVGASGADIQNLVNRYNQISKDATSPMDRWLAYGKAWEEWDEPHWSYKLISETSLDPTNTIDVLFSTMVRSARIMRIPILGKFLGETNAARNTIADLPYTIGKAVDKVLPKTTRNRALAHTQQFTNDVLTITGIKYGKFAEGGFMAEEIADSIKTATTSYMRDPLRNIDSPAGRVGAYLSTIRFVEDDEIIRMAKYLGLPADYKPSNAAILNVNTIFENTNPILARERSKSLLQVPEASSLLLRSFPEVTPSIENLQKATQIVTNKLEQTLRGIDFITSTSNPQEILRRGMRRIYSTFTNNADSAVAVRRRDMKMLGGFLNKMDYLGKVVWRDTLERQVSTRMAGYYLYTLSYGPQNINEAAFRSLLDGVIPTVGTRNIHRYQRNFQGLEAASYNLRAHRPRMEYSPLTPVQQVGLDPTVDRAGMIPGVTRPIETLRKATQKVSGNRLSIGSFADLNKESAEIGTEMAANFNTQKYLEHLRLDNPEAYRTIMQAIPEVSHLNWRTLTKKDIDGIMQYISEEALRGPEAVEGVKGILRNLTNRKATVDAANALNLDTVTQQPIKDAILREAQRGTLWDNIDDVLERAAVDGDIMNMQQLEYAGLMYDDMAKGLAGVEIANEEELLYYFNQLNTITEAPERLVSISRQSFEDRVMDIIDEGTRRKLHDQDWAILTRFIDESSTATSDIIHKLQTAARTMKPSQMDNLLTLGDKYRLRMEAWTMARNLESELFHSRFASKGKLDSVANQAWWDTTNALRRGIWNDAKSSIQILEDEIGELAEVISNVKLPPIRQFGVGGKLVPEDVAYIFTTTGDEVSRNLYLAETRSLLGKDNFYAWVRRRATTVAKQAGKTADEIGFTREAIDGVYDQLVHGMRLDPRVVNVLTPQREALEGIRQQLHSIKNGMGVDEADIAQLRKVVDDTVGNLKRTPQFTSKESTESWRVVRNQAAEKAREDYSKAFTQYGPENIVNSFFHAIHPFWTYEIQRWPWLWRTFTKHPGLFTAGTRYLDYSDRGYMHIPGTSLEINPFRSTVFMGMFTGLFMRDYPEYEDYFPGLANWADRWSRMGFYPSVFYTLPLTMLGATGRPEWGPLFPQFVRTPLETIAFMFPESTVAKTILEQILPNRFRQFLAIRELGNMGIKGSRIYGKVRLGDKLEPEEQSIWDRAQSQASGYSAMFEQTAVLRFNPEERRTAYRLYGQMLEELTGVPVELQERSNRLTSVTGKRFIDLVPLDPLMQDQIQELEALKLWAGATIPLQPSSLQAQQIRINQFWDEYERIRDKQKTGFYDREGELIQLGQEQLDDALMKWRRGEPGGIGPDQWVRMRGELQAYTRAQFETLSNSEKFKDVPVTLEERVKYMQEQRSIQPTFHPAQELLWLYYELQPELVFDEDTGQMVYDFDTYFSMVDWLIDAVPEPHRDRFIQMIQKDWTPLVTLRWEDSRRLLRPYRNVRIVELSQYDEEEQAIIKRYSSASATERQAMRNVLTDSGQKLISKYEADLTRVRRNLRLIYPHSNAVLSFWNPAIALLTPEAGVIYEELMEDRLGKGKSVAPVSLPVGSKEP